MPGDFDCVYLDTEVLKTQGWPRQSAELQVFLFLTKHLGLGVFLPEGAEIERRHQWESEMLDTINAVQAGWDRLDKRYTELADLNLAVGKLDQPVVISAPTELSKAYDELADPLKNHWNIQVVPLVKRDSTLLFELAVHKKAAFEESGKGFQDTLIYFSALEHLHAKLPSRGAFVSGDKVFRTQPVEELTHDAGVEMEHFSSLESIISFLKSRLADPKGRWALDVHTAEQSLNLQKPVVERYVRAELTPRLDQLAGFEVAYLKDLHIANVYNVQTPPLDDRKPGDKVRLSFNVSVRMRVASVFDTIHERGRFLEVDLRLEAEALWTGDRYEEVKPLGPLSTEIEKVTEEIGALRTLSGMITFNELVLRAEGYTESLGDLRLELSGRVPSRNGELVHVDVLVLLDTFVSGRLDSDGLLDVVLTSDRGGVLAKAKTKNTNGVIFESVPLGTGGSALNESWTISGIRADVSTTGILQGSQASSVTASVEVITADPDRPRVEIIREAVKVATVRLGVTPDVRTWGAVELHKDGDGYQRYWFVVGFRPLFPGALKTKRQESNGASLATHGTVCAIHLANVPLGFKVFATLHEIAPTANPPVATAVLTDSAGLPKEPIEPVTGIDWDGAPMTEVKPYRATWEIVDEKDRIGASELHFGLSLVGPADHGPFEFTVQAGLGPSYAASLEIRTASARLPIPRFQNLNAPVKLEADCSRGIWRIKPRT